MFCSINKYYSNIQIKDERDGEQQSIMIIGGETRRKRRLGKPRFNGGMQKCILNK